MLTRALKIFFLGNLFFDLQATCLNAISSDWKDAIDLNLASASPEPSIIVQEVVGNAESFGRNITTTLNTNLVFVENAMHTYAGDISGDGNFVLQGIGLLTLTGANTYTGNTLLEQGELFIPSPANIGAGSIVFGPGLTNSTSSALFASGNLSNAIEVADGFSGSIGTSDTLTLSGPIVDAPFSSGSSRVEFFGRGIAILANAGNSYVGDTYIRENATLAAGGDHTLPCNSSLKISCDAVLQVGDFVNTVATIADQSEGQITLGNTGRGLLKIAKGGCYSGTASGAGGIHLLGGMLQLQEANTYVGGTTIDGGTLALIGAGSLAKEGFVNLNGPAIFDISGITASSETIGDLIGVNKSAITYLGDKSLSVGTSNNTTYAGAITGSGGHFVKQGSGLLDLKGFNTYGGGTTVSGGFLRGNTDSLQGDIVVDGGASLIFHQLGSGTYEGSLSGDGALLCQGKARLNFTGNSSAFTGTTDVKNGNFALNSLLGGDVFVQHSGLISGTGTALGDLRITNGGSISPGNSIGTLNVVGDYTQDEATTYFVEINGRRESDLINVDGIATLNGGQVIVSAPKRIFRFDDRYTILTAAGGVNGRYDGVSAPGVLSIREPNLFYSANNVFLDFFLNFINVANTFNERQVAIELNQISNRAPSQTVILEAIANLPESQIPRVLNQLSGEQHTSDLVATGMMSRSFIRRLYDPLRPLVTTECGRSCECSDMDVWFEAGGGTAHLNSDGNAFGFKMNFWELTAGIQQTFCDDFTVGVAGSYERDTLHYHLGGTGTMNSGCVGLYGLYRPCEYYVIVDLAYGHGEIKVKRPVEIEELILTAESFPSLNNVSFYVESGVDIALCGVLLQPFVGLETYSFWRSGVKESIHFSDFGLDVKSRDRTDVSSRLGVHLTTTSWPSGLALSVDVAWQCRLTSTRNEMNESFAGFGDEFAVRGARLSRSSAEGALTLSNQITECFRVYAELSGEVWSHASIYGLLGGVQVSF